MARRSRPASGNRAGRHCLAIENTSRLYADIHMANNLRDTITLAEMAGIGVCIDVSAAGRKQDSRADQRALPRCELVQVSDYVLGDRALPSRAVPGDGAIPIGYLRWLRGGGYRHVSI